MVPKSVRVELNTNPSPPEMLASAGAVATVVAAFLPWIAAGVDAGPVAVNDAVTGIETVGVGSLVLGVAVLALLLVMTTDGRPVATAVGGLLIGLVALWKFVDLGGAADPGLGLYLTAVVGLAALLGGAWAYSASGGESMP